MYEDAQKIWDDYYDRIKRRRLKAAELLWGEIENAGTDEETIFALDFTHFGNNRDNLGALAQQLSEYYTIEILECSEPNYWNIRGTTRPEGVCLTRSEHAEWVEFMVDVSRSYACVFSGWTLEAPALGRTFHSEYLDDD